MTQTQTPPEGTPDPDRRPDPDPGPDAIQTRTQTPIQTQTRTRTGPDDHPDPSPGLGGPETDQTRTAQTRTPTPDPSARVKIDNRSESGPDDVRTQTTQTQTRTRTTVGRRAEQVRGWIGAGGYLTALTVVVGIVASIGQKEYAETKAKFTTQIRVLGLDLTPWFAPFVFDLAVAALLHGGLRAAKARHSPWPWWLCGAAVAGLSTYTNFDHDGGRITGTASIGLFVIWGLFLLNEYKTIIRNREIEDSADDEFRSTDVLFTVDKPLADRAWFIARTKPLAVGLRYRHRLGETDLTKRDLAILAARIYRDVFADQLDVLMNPTAAAPAGSTSNDEKVKTPKTKAVHWWHRRRRARAYRLATMTAGDAVDRLFGLPVPERSGVIIAKVTYAAQDDRPLLGSVTATAHVPNQQIATAAAPAALPAAPHAAPIAGAAVRRRVTAAPVAAQLPPAEDTVVVVTEGAPAGNAGKNWLPLDKIPGLPEIDPAIVCECHIEQEKRCGKTLAEHVKRRGVYVRMIVTTVDKWDSRPERVGKTDIKEVCGVGGSGTQNEMAWVFDQLRAIAKRQREGGDAAATLSAQVIDAASAAEVVEAETSEVSEETATEK